MVAERPRLGWLQTGGHMPLNRQILSDPDNRVTMDERRYLVERVRMAQWWSDYLDQLKTAETGQSRAPRKPDIKPDIVTDFLC